MKKPKKPTPEKRDKLYGTECNLTHQQVYERRMIIYNYYKNRNDRTTKTGDEGQEDI